MSITEEELSKILSNPNSNIEKHTTISSDGKNLLTRIPREIVRFLNLSAGQTIFWNVDSGTNEIKIIIQNKK